MAKGKHNKSQSSNAFQKAVEATQDIKADYKKGISAIERKYRNKIISKDTALLGGSVDIDFCTTEKYPQDNRWDYVLDYDDQSYFVEFHSANTSEISTVIKKLQWLKDWLTRKAPELNKLKAKQPYHWIQSKGFDILKTSRQYKQIAQVGLIPKSILNLPL